MTKAAVKAEALALKKAEEKEAKRLKDLEWNQRDETEFETWKTEMDQRDEVLRIDYIQRRKIEMELSREEAILAQEKKTHQNRLNARGMKKEAGKRMVEREKNDVEETKKKVQIHDAVTDQKVNT